MATIAVRTHHDDLLGVVAPFAIAASRSTVIVVDLDPAGIAFPSRRTLADLVSDGARLAELIPDRVGVASLGNGGIASDDAESVVEALQRGWPNVVLRVAPSDPRPRVDVVPGVVGGAAQGPHTVWVGGGAPSDAATVKAPTRRAFHAALAGRQLRGRWLSSWNNAMGSMWR